MANFKKAFIGLLFGILAIFCSCDDQQVFQNPESKYSVIKLYRTKHEFKNFKVYRAYNLIFENSEDTFFYNSYFLANNNKIYRVHLYPRMDFEYKYNKYSLVFSDLEIDTKDKGRDCLVSANLIGCYEWPVGDTIKFADDWSMLKEKFYDAILEDTIYYFRTSYFSNLMEYGYYISKRHGIVGYYEGGMEKFDGVRWPLRLSLGTYVNQLDTNYYIHKGTSNIRSFYKDTVDLMNYIKEFN